MSDRLPALFLSHGAPLLAVDDGPARRFLSTLGQSVPRPRAILVVSAHWETERPAVTVSTAPDTIHDFFGFPEALYRLRYPAPGDPAVAGRVMQLLGAAGLQAEADYRRGLDHGAWVPLLLAWPSADIPVLQLSLQTHLGPAHHLALGAALSPLADEGVLVIGSGSATHDLRGFRGHGQDDPPEDYAREFADWLVGCVESGDAASVIDYRARGPQAARNHPSEEHFLPLLVAMGAGGGVAGRRIHASFTYGVLAMDGYAFG
jgi:4,5-DOPA dioxygenase extradiol